jgi:Na+-driven multidrug efflux pump
LWAGRFTHEAAVLASAALYFHWAGPCYALFGLGLCLYFSALAAGKVGGPVLAGTLRLVVIAIGGSILAAAHAPSWTIFALVALGMAAYGLASVIAVRYTIWGKEI